MKTFLQTLFFYLLITQIGFAQLEFFETKEQSNKTSEKLTDGFNVNLDSLMLDSIMAAYKNSQSLPGIATLIIKDNEMIWNRNYGYRNLQYQLPVEDSTFFLVGSISKTIVATAVMQLWENGLIELDNSINDYLPSGFTVVNPYFPNDPITVKMLMTHTSNLQDNWNIMDYLWTCGDYPVTYDTFLVNYFTPGGTYCSQNNFYNYPPGQNWNYSNSGSCLLALIVEHLSGKSFNEYTKDSIFIPLSMNNSSWFLTGLDTTKIATPCMHVPPVPMCQTGMAYWPIGQLRTNKFELSNFLSAYINGGVFNNNRILNNSTIELMLTDQSGFIHMSGGVQGLIWYTDPNIYSTVWGHSGGWYGATAWMFCNLTEKWGGFLFINWATPPNYPSISLNRQMAYYAHLYGNIYSLNPSVDISYAKIKVDSVLFRTRFSNIYNHQFIPHLIYANLDSTQIDSLTLFDDGLHGDSLSNDGIYGGYIPQQQNENFYFLGVSTIDLQINKYFSTPDICRFTTVGPVIIDSLTVTYNPVPKTYKVKPYVKNNSQSLTVENLSINMTSDDSAVTYISSALSIASIAPGEIVLPSGYYTVRVNTNFSGLFSFNFEIKSSGWSYWKDSVTYIVTDVEENLNEIPTEFLLSQNYPNPFNPSTEIKYSIPQSSNVVIKVFDILGNEIETLVNEEQPVGVYEAEFKSQNLSSGIYFYKLQAGSFVSTKKMLLLK